MTGLDSLAERLRAGFDAVYGARERGLAACRQAIRHSANAIRALHRGEGETADRLLREARSLLDDAEDALAAHPAIRWAGFVHDAEKEYAEGRLTEAVIAGRDIPGPEDLRVTPEAYLNGMAETVGELRRHLLDLLRRAQIARAEEILQCMDAMHDLLASIDFPEAMTAGLRRSTDAARAILERTRADLATTVVQHRLEEALERHARGLEP